MRRTAASVANPEVIDTVDEMYARAWEQLVGRLNGPMSLRFVLQPIIAAAFAIRAGVRDAGASKAPYLWTVISDARERRTLLRSGWRDVGNVFVMAAVLDGIYQIGVLRFFYPVQMLLVAAVLAFIPYVVTRGVAARISRAYRRRNGLQH